MLVDVGTGACFQLNQVGAEVWSLLAESRDLGAIVDTLALRYRVEQTVLERDVLRLVAELTAAGLASPTGRDST